MSKDAFSLGLAALLRPLVADLVQHELARVAAPVEHYTSRLLPPGKTRRWFREHARNIPGAYKSGNAWIVGRDAYERWCRERSGIVPTPAEWSASAVLDAVSRATKRRVKPAA